MLRFNIALLLTLDIIILLIFDTVLLFIFTMVLLLSFVKCNPRNVKLDVSALDDLSDIKDKLNIKINNIFNTL